MAGAETRSRKQAVGLNILPVPGRSAGTVTCQLTTPPKPALRRHPVLPPPFPHSCCPRALSPSALGHHQPPHLGPGLRVTSSQKVSFLRHEPLPVTQSSEACRPPVAPSRDSGSLPGPGSRSRTRWVPALRGGCQLFLLVKLLASSLWAC